MRFEMAAPVGSASDDKVHHFVTPPAFFFLLAGHCNFKSLFTSCTENAHFPLKFNLLIFFSLLFLFSYLKRLLLLYHYRQFDYVQMY